MRLAIKLGLWVQKFALKLGIVIRRSGYQTREDLRLLRFLEIYAVDTILDVGAHSGDYADTLIRGGFTGNIYSFEALPEMHRKLSLRAAKMSSRWIIAPHCAISNSKGRATFNVAKSVSVSSLLPPSKNACDLPGVFSMQESIEVPTETIAECCEILKIKSERIFLKLDIQGGEELALQGAEEILNRVVGLVVEMPLQIYYEGQASIDKLDSWIKKRGFEVWDIQPVWRHPNTGRLNHLDVMYVRSGNLD